jgi:hypothetical protein
MGGLQSDLIVDNEGCILENSQSILNPSPNIHQSPSSSKVLMLLE